jgi:hypothetical protein
MTAKYSTDQDRGRQWDRDRRYVLYEWSSKPFVGHRHRHERVEQRIVIEYTHGVGVDIRWEARSEDTGKIPDEWTAVETIEVRDYGARHDRHAAARWLK